MEFRPYPYQTYCIKRILAQPEIGLFLDMGMGKTVSTLTAVDELLYSLFAVSKVLVIAPLRVAKETWSREAEKWDHLQHLRVAKILGSARQRAAALAEDADIYIVNRENVPWLVERYKKRWPFDMVVVDELSSFKSPKAQRFKALRRVRPYIERIVGLTGTPAPNGLLDLWAQVYLLDVGERLGRTLGGYRNRYFTPDKRNGQTVFSWALRPGAEEAIRGKLEDLCVSMASVDYLTLPERTDVVVPVTLGAAGRELYKRMERDLLLSLGEDEICALSAAALVGKLLQIANGAVYDEDHKVHAIHADKLDALGDLVEQAQGQPMLVYYNYRHDRERIRAAFPQAEDLDFERWNAGLQSVALAHPASAGHGLNLQAGGSVIVWYGLTWNLEHYQQANARLHRQGQRQPVRVYHLVAQDTVDEQVMAALARKASGQAGLMDALKVRVERIKQIG